MTNAIAASITITSTIIAFIVASPQLRVSFPRPEQRASPSQPGDALLRSHTRGAIGAGKVISLAHGLNSGLIQQTHRAAFIGNQTIALHLAKQTSHSLARAAGQFGYLQMTVKILESGREQNARDPRASRTSQHQISRAAIRRLHFPAKRFRDQASHFPVRHQPEQMRAIEKCQRAGFGRLCRHS